MANTLHVDTERLINGDVFTVCYAEHGTATVELYPLGDGLYHCKWCDTVIAVSENK